MELVKNIPISKESKKFEDCVISAFIDCSGSTSGGILESQKKIIFNLMKNCKQKNFVFWDYKIQKIYENIDNFDSIEINSGGGTNPISIINNEKSLNILKKSDIIIFSTDGQIFDNYVTQFSEKLSNILSNKTVLSFIFSSGKPNISCIAPLMTKSNHFINMVYDVNKSDLKLLYKKGIDLDLYIENENENKDEKEEDEDEDEDEENENENENENEIKLRKIKDINITTESIPDNYIIINTKNDSHTILNYDKFINFNSIYDIKLNEDEWKNIIRYSLVSGDADKIRKIINTFQNIETNSVKNSIKNRFKHFKRREYILMNIIKNRINNNKNEINYDELKNELKRIDRKATKESYEYNKTIKKEFLPIKHKWDKLRDIIYQFENSNNKYDATNFINMEFGSNRAKRGKDLDLELDGSNLNHKKVPLIDCSIHLDKGPAVLWLKKFEDIKYSTDDKLVTFPLKYRPKMVDCIVQNPVCGLCAEYYIKSTDVSTYREKIVGYIPLNWKHTYNIRYAINTICKSYCGSKQVSHNKILMLSIMDDIYRDPEIHKWLPREVVYYFRDQLIKNVATYDTFSCQGKRTKIIKALDITTKKREDMIRQPLTAGLKILLMASEYNLIDNEEAYVMANYCILYELIDDFRVSTNKEGAIKRAKERIYKKEELNDILNSILNKDIICIDDFSFFLKEDEKMFIKRLEYRIGITFNNDKVLRYFVTNMLKINSNQKCLTIYNNMKPIIPI